MTLLLASLPVFAQVAIPTDTPGLAIPQIYYLNITNIRPPGLLVVPKISRTNAGERPYTIEPSRGSFSSTLGNLMSTDNNSWLGVGHDTFGVKFIYTMNMGLPFWMGASGNSGATPTITTAPFDWNSTNESCIAVGSNPAFTSANGDCFLKEFVHFFMQKTCGVTSTPSTPLVGQCKVNFFETGNEVNSSGFWSDTPASLAKISNDETIIIRQYCGDCMILGPSVSAGGDGFAPNFATGGGQFDNALGQVLDAWQAIPGASLPDAVSFHLYPNHTNVSPPAFPETFVSHSDTKCTAANTPNSACRTALKDQVALIKAMIAARPWLAAKNPPIFNTESGWNGNNTISVDTQSVTYVDGGGTKTATIPGPLSWQLRQAWYARYFLFASTSGVSVNLPYQADNDCYDSMIAYGDTGSQRNHSSCTTEPVLLPLNNTFTNVAGGTVTPDSFSAGTGLRGLLPTGVAHNTLVGWLHNAIVTSPPSLVSGDVWKMDYTDSTGKASRIVWNTNWLTTEPYANNFGTMTDLNGTSSTIAGGTVTIENRPIRLTGAGVAADFSIAAFSAAVTAPIGGTQPTVTVTSTPSGGFSGSETVTISGLPSNLTASPASFTLGASGSQPVLITTAAQVPTGLTVISGLNIIGDYSMFGSSFSNTLLTNSTISGALKIDGASNVYVQNNKLGSVWFRGTLPTDNITIDNNEITGAGNDCIQLFDGSNDATNVVIENNSIHNCGTAHPGDTLYHAIYDQVPGVTIQGNHIWDCMSCISIRNSGTITGNTITQVNFGGAIEYFYDHTAPGGSTLTITNNVLDTVLTNAAANIGSFRGLIVLGNSISTSNTPVANYVISGNLLNLRNTAVDSSGTYVDIYTPQATPTATLTNNKLNNLIPTGAFIAPNTVGSESGDTTSHTVTATTLPSTITFTAVSGALNHTASTAATVTGNLAIGSPTGGSFTASGSILSGASLANGSLQ